MKRSGKPGPIDNKALQLKKNVLVPDLVGAANVAFLAFTKARAHTNALQLVDEDYIFLKKEAWAFLYKLYKGGPVFERFMVDMQGVKFIELYPTENAVGI